MNENLNRVFDQVKPSPEQKEVMLNRLLEPERKVKPMKKLKKLAVFSAAAALMVISCAAAVVTGFDQRMAEYFHAEPEQVELLGQGTKPLQITAENNGATLQATQILIDRCSILVMVDFTAPEGTVLDLRQWDFVSFGMGQSRFLDGNGEVIEASSFCAIDWELLDDEDPADNHAAMLFTLTQSEGMEFDQKAACFRLDATDLQAFDTANPGYVTLYSGNWTMEIPMPQEDIGYTQQLDCLVGQLDGVNITAKEVYLSPMTLCVTLEREVPLASDAIDDTYRNWVAAIGLDQITLKDRDGTTISLEDAGGKSTAQNNYGMFRLSEITDPARLQDGTLTLRIGDGSVDIPLDNLVPAE